MRFIDPAVLPVRLTSLPVQDLPHITVPNAPASGDGFEQAIHSHFTDYLRRMTWGRPETRVLSAIRYAADIMRHGDALVAKTLADLGLRAPREAFPQSFLDFIDRSLARPGIVPASSVMDLVNHWASAA